MGKTGLRIVRIVWPPFFYLIFFCFSVGYHKAKYPLKRVSRNMLTGSSCLENYIARLLR